MDRSDWWIVAALVLFFAAVLLVSIAGCSTPEATAASPYEMSCDSPGHAGTSWQRCSNIEVECYKYASSISCRWK